MENEAAAAAHVVKTVVASNISWCSGADDWGDDDDGTTGVGDTFMRVDTGNLMEPEENGNVIRYENSKISDEDEESNSLENDPVPGFGNLRVDERNANGGGGGGGAKGGLIDNLYTSKATAEIEGTEGDVVVVDTPLSPKRDLLALLKQPQVIPRDLKDVTLKSFYIAVDEERSSSPVITEHVRELLQEYQRHEEGECSGMRNF